MILRFCYHLLSVVAIPLALIRLWVKGRAEPGYRQNIGERFGSYCRHKTPTLWVHAVSVGEARSVVPLIKAWHARYPKDAIMVTVTTPAGKAVLLGASLDFAEIYFSPWDNAVILSNIYRRRRFKAIWLVEKELWPLYLRYADRHGVPVYTLSMNLSEKSAKRYAKIRSVFANFNAIRRALCQDEVTAQRARLFLPHERVYVAGSLKFDLHIPENIEHDAQSLNEVFAVGGRELVLFASTHEGEERLIHNAIPELLRDNPSRLIAIMPRHPQRFEEVIALFDAKSTARRSMNRPLSSDTRVIIIDAMGEALTWMQLSSAVIVCGSLISGVGGHNVLEPIALNRAVMVGPYNENNEGLIRQLLEQNAITQLMPEKLADGVNALLTSDKTSQVRRASAIYQNGRGALRRHLAILENDE